jgi:hypothetical protein
VYSITKKIAASPNQCPASKENTSSWITKFVPLCILFGPVLLTRGRGSWVYNSDLSANIEG